MTEVKKKWNYTYDFPEQRELCAPLNGEDKRLIAEKIGCTRGHVISICNGRRRMKPEVKSLVEQILKLKQQMKSIEVKLK